MTLVLDYDPELAAAKGAALCDVIDPGWAEEIDTDRLDQASGCDCIGGQLCGGYEKLASSFGDNDRKLAEYGFCLPRDYGYSRIWWTQSSWTTRLKAWRRLTYYWRQEIDRRLP